MTCKAKQENNGVCPHHNLQCGWPKCNEPEQPAQKEPVCYKHGDEPKRGCAWCDKQPAQDEPVAYRSRWRNTEGQIITGWVAHTDTTENPDPRQEIEPLYTRPQAREPEQPAQQEPVAWQYRDSNNDGTWGAWLGCDKRLSENEYRQVRALFTSPPPCPTCEALARTVMLDQTSHDTHRKPTDEMVVAAARVLSDRQAAACNVDFGDMWKLHGNDFIEDARAALEAANSIREKNT